MLILSSALLWIAGQGCGGEYLQVPAPLYWQGELARVFPADVDRDGEPELITLYRSPDQQRSLLEAIQVRTGKRLWSRLTIPCPEGDALSARYRQESVDDARLLLFTEADPLSDRKRAAIALHRLSDGQLLWSREVGESLGSFGHILTLAGPLVLVTSERSQGKRSRRTLHVLRAADGVERCSVPLSLWPRTAAVIGKWLVWSGFESHPHYYNRVLSLTDCKQQSWGRAGGLTGMILCGRGALFVLGKQRFHAKTLLVQRFDEAAGKLVPVKHHAKLGQWGLDESGLIGLPVGLLRQHQPATKGDPRQLTLYDWPPATTVRWTAALPRATSLNRAVGNEVAKPPVFRARKGRAPPPPRRFLPLQLIGDTPPFEHEGPRRLSLLDLQTGKLTWSSAPVAADEARWGRLLYRPGVGSPQSLIAIRYRKEVAPVSDLIWVLDGHTGRTLRVVDGALRFAPWQVAGDRIFGIYPGSSPSAPYVYDLRRGKLLLGADPRSLFRSRRARLERLVGPLP